MYWSSYRSRYVLDVVLVDPLLVTSGDLTQVQEVQVGSVNSGNHVGEAEVEGKSALHALSLSPSSHSV